MLLYDLPENTRPPDAGSDTVFPKAHVRPFVRKSVAWAIDASYDADVQPEPPLSEYQKDEVASSALGATSLPHETQRRPDAASHTMLGAVNDGVFAKACATTVP